MAYPEPFATVDQYEARYGEAADKNAVAECLDDASAAIRAALAKAGVDYSEPSEDFADRLMRVCRSAADRLMPKAGIPVGVTQLSKTAGPYTQSTSYQPSYGTAKLLPSELSLLGIPGSSGRMLRPGCGVDHV